MSAVDITVQQFLAMIGLMVLVAEMVRVIIKFADENIPDEESPPSEEEQKDWRDYL